MQLTFYCHQGSLDRLPSYSDRRFSDEYFSDGRWTVRLKDGIGRRTGYFTEKNRPWISGSKLATILARLKLNSYG